MVYVLNGNAKQIISTEVLTGKDG